MPGILEELTNINLWNTVRSAPMNLGCARSQELHRYQNYSTCTWVFTFLCFAFVKSCLFLKMKAIAQNNSLFSTTTYQSLTHITLVDTQFFLQFFFFAFWNMKICEDLFGNWWCKQRSVLSDKNLVLSRWNHQWLFCDHHNLTVLIATISCLVVSDPALEAQTVPLHIQH